LSRREQFREPWRTRHDGFGFKMASACYSRAMSKPTKAEMHTAVRRARGIIRRKPGERPSTEWWADHQAEERALEDRRAALPAPPNLADSP
jgi:hypothetical protein